jgi:hypothetical protein
MAKLVRSRDAFGALMSENERWTAFHEAGHAVVMVRLGLATKRVTILGDEESLGHSEASELGQWFRPDIEVDSRVARRIQSEVMVGWAGTLAEERAGRDDEEALRRGAQRDLDKIAWLSGFVTESTEEQEAYISWLGIRTDNLLGRWDVCPCVEAVTDDLLERRTLSGRRVREVYRDAITRRLELGRV